MDVDPVVRVATHGEAVAGQFGEEVLQPLPVGDQAALAPGVAAGRRRQSRAGPAACPVKRTPCPASNRGDAAVVRLDFHGVSEHGHPAFTAA